MLHACTNNPSSNLSVSELHCFFLLAGTGIALAGVSLYSQFKKAKPKSKAA